MQKYIEKLNEILTINNICPSHGIDHAISVLNHAEKAIDALKKEEKDSVTLEIIEAIKLAALLHDADDKKFFPYNSNYENLRTILSDKSDEFISSVIYMVSLVSASKNGDTIPEQIFDKQWLLIPRYADRLEAIGIIGIKRCYVYNIGIKMPLFIDSTPRLTTDEDILSLASERYKSYCGNSNSMIDHYYDKLIGISIFPYKNTYFDIESAIRRQPILDFVKYFSINGEIDMTHLTD